MWHTKFYKFSKNNKHHIYFINCFYKVPFSAPDQIHCAHSCSMRFWISDSILFSLLFPLFFFYSAFFFFSFFKLILLSNNPSKWCTDSAVWLLHGWCKVKLVLSRCMFCVHHTTMHQFTESFYSKLHMYVCLHYITLQPRQENSPPAGNP